MNSDINIISLYLKKEWLDKQSHVGRERDAYPDGRRVWWKEPSPQLALGMWFEDIPTNSIKIPKCLAYFCQRSDQYIFTLEKEKQINQVKHLTK